MTDKNQFTNRLAHETSPYLRQHAHNPVDWYPWGDEAITKAKELDRPIFLSIGYSACHWCHVMEKESFEDPEIGRILNDNFISIKVDREERPDLDQIYMAAVQILTRQGGWPMSMFLTPDLQPFYGGTYFPPDFRYHRPSFRQVLQAIIDAWVNRRDQVFEQAQDLTKQVQLLGELRQDDADSNEELFGNVIPTLSRAFDPHYGGFGMAPKFPHAMDLMLLLRCWKRFQNEEALQMVRKTLNAMAMGGIYDHLGGGFHRYSTDQKWLVPHFEKMLYDNALLTVAYLEGFQATHDPFYREVVEETLDYVEREMLSDEGGFFSTQDADSEGVEGKFFVWSRDEIENILGDESAQAFCHVYNVSTTGNWEGHNILHRTASWKDSAQQNNTTIEVLLQQIADQKKMLFDVRRQRIWPGRDEKVLTSWNGLMIDAFAKAAQVLANPKYDKIASKAAEFIWTTMRSGDGRLFRTYSAGSQAKFNAYLEDYAFYLSSLISLYETNFHTVWLERAISLTEVMIEQFWDDENNGFFYTGKDHETLIARGKDPHDSSIPSGNSVAVCCLLRLHKLTGDANYLVKATQTLKLFSGIMKSSPSAAAQMLIALDFHLGTTQEFAIVGDPQSDNVGEALRIIHHSYLPNKIVACGPSDKTSPVALLHDRPQTGDPTVYICENFACQAPMNDLEELRSKLTGMVAK